MCDIGQANSLPCSESEQSVSEANWLSESSVARLAAWVSVRKCLESVEPSLDSDGFSAGWGDGEDGAICRPTLLRSDERKGRRCVLAVCRESPLVVFPIKFAGGRSDLSIPESPRSSAGRFGVRWHGKTTPEYSEVKWVVAGPLARPSMYSVPTEVKRSGSLQEPLLPAHERQTQSERTRIDAWFSWVTPTKLLRCNPRVGGGGLSLYSALRRPEDLATPAAQLQDRLERSPSEALLRSLVVVFWPSMATATAFKLSSDIIRYLPPLMLSHLLQCLSDGGSEDDRVCSGLETYFFAFALPITTLCQALLVNQYFCESA